MTRCLSIMLLSGALAQVYGAEPDASESNSAAERWLNRARQYAERAKAEDVTAIWVEVVAFHVKAGRIEEAHVILDGIEDHDVRGNCAQYVSHPVAWAGKREAAVRFAQAIEDPELRNHALGAATVPDIAQHSFLGAMTTVRLIEDPDTASILWGMIANAQAEAGQYDAARESVEHMLTDTDHHRESVSRKLKFIAKAKASGLRRPPADRRSNPIEDARRSAAAFADVELATDDVIEVRAKAAGASNADERTSLWRQAAWLCHKANEPDGCREAVDAATRHVEKISDDYRRSVHYMLIADLEIELGNCEEAKKLVERAKTAEGGLGVFRDLWQFTSGNVAISVLVRCGAIDEAFNLAQVDVGGGGRSDWLALGSCCAAVGKASEVEGRLDKIESDGIKAHICLGVYQALQAHEME